MCRFREPAVVPQSSAPRARPAVLLVSGLDVEATGEGAGAIADAQSRRRHFKFRHTPRPARRFNRFPVIRRSNGELAFSPTTSRRGAFARRLGSSDGSPSMRWKPRAAGKGIALAAQF